MNNLFHTEDDSLTVGSKTWSHAMESVNKMGYREGIEEGSEALFQKDFDAGYVDGFRVAYLRGRYKYFANFLLKQFNHPKEINDILEENNTKMCFLCEFESSNENIKTYPEVIINNHREHMKKILNTLYLYFYPLLIDRGIDISDLKYV